MRRRQRLSLAILALLAVVPLRAAIAQAADDSSDQRSYSYVRTLDGQATLASAGNGPGEGVVAQQPLQQGDQIRVERGARLEIALADRNLLRVDGDTTLTLARVAFSADRDDRTTQLDLDDGEVVLEVTAQALGDELPEIKTPSANVYIHDPGTYRVRVAGDGSTELTVRDGYAELLTGRGSTVVRADELAWAPGDGWSNVQVAAAGSLDGLERWGSDLDRQATAAANDRTLHVEPYLAYQASNLDAYGDWVTIDASWYWRPRVATGWRPYWQGNWSWTPSGMTWVSTEPWGWVPYHYGSWTLVAGYGWVWRPGAVYSPAWVYWYCSPSWTGWVPVGYYTDHYRPYWSGGFRFGVYGWTGGSWGVYSDWTFCPTLDVGHRGRHHRYRGGELEHVHGIQPPRGILTTDTRRIPRGGWDRPDDLVRVLRSDPRARRERGGDLPSVTDFVARRRELPAAVADVVRPDPATRGFRRRTPLDPGAPAVTGVEVRRGDAPRSEAARWRNRIDTAGGRGALETGRGVTRETPRAIEPGGSPRGGAGEAWGSRIGSRDNPQRNWSPRGDDVPSRLRAERPDLPQSPRAAEPRDLPQRETPSVDGRQGWRLRGGWGDRTGGNSDGSVQGGSRAWTGPEGNPSAANRVITGVRRNQGDATRQPTDGWRRFSAPQYPARPERPQEIRGGEPPAGTAIPPGSRWTPRAFPQNRSIETPQGVFRPGTRPVAPAAPRALPAPQGRPSWGGHEARPTYRAPAPAPPTHSAPPPRSAPPPQSHSSGNSSHGGSSHGGGHASSHGSSGHGGHGHG